MPHNGYRSQTNCWFLSYGDAMPFINIYKDSGSLTYSDNTGIPPSELNAYGFLNRDKVGSPGTGGRVVFWMPTQAMRAGKYVAKWKGYCSISGTLGSASASSNGRLGSIDVSGLTPDTGPFGYRIVFDYASTNTIDPLTCIAVVHEDDEAAWDAEYALEGAGKVFTDAFLAKVNKYGVTRVDLDWCDRNHAIITKFDHRKPYNYGIWAGDEIRASIYKGTTGGSANAYTITLGDGGTPQDGDLYIVTWHADATGSDPVDMTFNGKPLLSPNGTKYFFDTLLPNAGGTGAVAYDALLDAWIFRGGNSDPGTVYLANGAPIEVQLRLAKDAGSHPWFIMPFLATPENWLRPLATFVKQWCVAHNCTWMIPRYEGINENWAADFSGFFGNGITLLKAQARWGGDANTNDWYGYQASLMGAILTDVYGGGQGTSWHLVCGVWTSQYNQLAEHLDKRLAGKYATVDGGTPGSTYVTAIAPACYTDSGYTAQQYFNAAYAMNALDSGLQQAYADAFVQADVIWASGGWQTFAKAWGAAIAAKGKEMHTYEGAHGIVDRVGSDLSAAISGATKAASCVLTITGMKPSIGASLTPTGVVGMTELNGNTYSVTGVSGNNVTINVNSTGFTTYGSGGTATYTGSKTIWNAFIAAVHASTKLADMALHMNTHYALCGGLWPSTYVLNGSNPWGKCYDIFNPGGEYAGLIDFSTSAKPLRFRVTTS